MPTKEKLIKKLFADKTPTDYTVSDLTSLVSKCGCDIESAGRGSGIAIHHRESGRKTVFDAPHGGKPLTYQNIKKVKQFLIEIGEAENE